MVNAPEFLSPAAKMKWKELAGLLGEVAPREVDALALLCSSWATFLEASALLQRDGLILAGAGNHNGRTFANPAIGIQREAWKEICRLSKSFGLAPDRAAAGAGNLRDDILRDVEMTKLLNPE